MQEKTLDERMEDYIKWGDWDKVKTGIDYMQDSRHQYPELEKYEGLYHQHIKYANRQHKKWTGRYDK